MLDTDSTDLKKIRVLVADDHPGFREGVCRRLTDESDMEVIAIAPDGQTTVRLALELKPDVVIMDVAMPNTRGIEAAEQIKKACPQTAILMMSAYDYPTYILESMRVGVSGYLLKTTPMREIVGAVRIVKLGKSVFDFGNALISRITDDDKQRYTNCQLREREIEVLRYAARGISNKEIAKEIGISERTVQTHFANIFKKLGVDNRIAAVLCALKMGWFTPDDLPGG